MLFTFTNSVSALYSITAVSPNAFSSVGAVPLSSFTLTSSTEEVSVSSRSSIVTFHIFDDSGIIDVGYLSNSAVATTVVSLAAGIYYFVFPSVTEFRFSLLDGSTWLFSSQDSNLSDDIFSHYYFPQDLFEIDFGN